MKVIRVIVYEGAEEALRKMQALSKSLGTHVYSGYSMTIGEHLNELPPVIELSDDDVAKATEGSGNETVD